MGEDSGECGDGKEGNELEFGFHRCAFWMVLMAVIETVAGRVNAGARDRGGKWGEMIASAFIGAESGMSPVVVQQEKRGGPAFGMILWQ